MKIPSWISLVCGLVLAPASLHCQQPPGQRDPIGQKDVAFTFVVNCHDWKNLGRSAATLERLAKIYEKYGVRGEFYFTAPLFERYLYNHLDILLHLYLGGHTFSYHYRPPHPAYFRTSLTAQLEKLPLSQRVWRLGLNETRSLDLSLATYGGNMGGFFHPFLLTGEQLYYTVGAGAVTENLRECLLHVLRLGLGRSCVFFHEGGSRAEYPFFYRGGLLERASDFSITRWTAPGVAVPSFWWVMILNPSRAPYYDPGKRLNSTLAGLETGRLHLGQSLIHENNFYYSGTPWGPVYYYDSAKTRPKPPPFDLNATAPWARPRTPQQEATIWTAYENLVKAAAQHPRVACMTNREIGSLVLDDRYRHLTAAQVSAAARALLTWYASKGSLPEWIQAGGGLHVSLCEALIAFAGIVSAGDPNKLPAKVLVHDIMGPVDDPDLGGPGTGPTLLPQDQGKLALSVLAGLGPIPQVIPHRLKVPGGQVNAAEALLLLAQGSLELHSGKNLTSRQAPRFSIAGTSLARKPILWSQRPASRKR